MAVMALDERCTMCHAPALCPAVALDLALYLALDPVQDLALDLLWPHPHVTHHPLSSAPAQGVSGSQRRGGEGVMQGGQRAPAP